MIKNIRLVVAFTALFAFAGCSAPMVDEVTSEGFYALEGDGKADPDLERLLPAIIDGKIDVIIVKRKASIDNLVFSKGEILKAGVRDIKTGSLLPEAALAPAAALGLAALPNDRVPDDRVLERRL